MSPRKLSDSDKKEILNLYRHSAETTSTLAVRYGVSSSTISRFLKGNLSHSEYEELIQQKRLGRTPNRIQKELRDDESKVEQLSIPIIQPQQPSPEKVAETKISPPVIKETPTENNEEELLQEEEDDDVDRSDVIALQEMLGEELGDLDEDEDEDEDDWDVNEDEDPIAHLVNNVKLQVFPLSEANFPSICYLVIDRGAELITRPLKEFADLGTIPSEEIQQKTLPVFDNHRVARRFSNRFQRVIKVPDGRLLQKTSSYLEAKGITRLLIDGQVYSV